jgi:putative PEP-CTERM system TPR-repeat lipoprotein
MSIVKMRLRGRIFAPSVHAMLRPANHTIALRSFSLVLLIGSAACRLDPASARQRFLESGDRYAAAGKFSEAAIEYRNAVQKDPLAGNIRAKLADASLQTGDIAGALREYVRAADLLAEDANVQLKAGNLLLLAGRFDDAKARAEKVLAKDARNVDAQILLANAHAGLKDLDAAVAQIEDALRVDPDRSGTYSNLGALELSRGKRDAAAKAFKRAVELEPRSVAARLALGNFHWLTGDQLAAEDSLKQALALEPTNALTNRILASFYIATNRRADAEQPLKTVFDVAKTPAAALSLAEYYIAAGKGGAARAVLQPLLSDPRASVTAEVRLAALDYKDGHHTEAYRRLAAVLEKDKANLQALLVKSALLLADGKQEEALAGASLAVERHPDSASAQFMLGRVQAARSQPDTAIAAFQEVLRLNPRATEAKIALAQLHLAQGKPDASIGFAEEALANEPGNGHAHLVYVRGLLARGELDRANVELQQLLTSFPDSPAVHTQMGMLLGRKRDFRAARVEFERAAELDPASLEALRGLVALDLANRDYAGARARVDTRLASAPTAPVLTLAARVRAASGDFFETERLLRRALEVDDTYVAAYGALGQLYLSQKKLAPARAEFAGLAARSPKPAAALTMVGLILQIEGDVKGARDTFERVLQVDPEAAVAANNLAWIYAENDGNLDVALHLAQTAQKRLPGVAEVNDTLGFIYYKKNLASLAVATLKVSAEKDPDNPVYQYHLGLAYASAGDPIRARQSLNRALALKSDFDGAQQARSLLISLGSR